MLKSNILSVKRIPLSAFFYTLRPEETRLIILTLAHGVLHNLETGRLTIEEAETIIFNLETVQLCEACALTAKIVEMLEYGMELGDVMELAGREALTDAINDCLTLLDEAWNEPNVDQPLLRIAQVDRGKSTPTARFWQASHRGRP
jgi:hypothetical protein